MLQKNIFLLWLQGWENATWLNKQVAESWEINNPEWKIHYVDLVNLKNYVNDIDYIYDEEKEFLPQTKSDIIRLSLLKNHGGIWADATLLCMQPLDHWVHEAVEPSQFWMYHGHGGGMSKEIGPAIWFIISQKGEYIITKWKEEADNFWKFNYKTNNYFWMDEMFKNVFYKDSYFKELWCKVPYLYCELDGECHTLAHYGMENNTPHIKRMFERTPPYALKLWKSWNDMFPDINTKKCINSNGYFAIKLSKRKYCFKHNMSNTNVRLSDPTPHPHSAEPQPETLMRPRVKRLQKMIFN